MKIRKYLYKILIPLELMIFYLTSTQKNLFKFDYSTLSMTYFDLFLSGIILYFIIKYFKDITKDKSKLFSSKLSKCLMIILNLIVSFSIVAKYTFLSSYNTSIVIKGEYLFRYFLINILVFPIIYSIYYFIKNFKLNLDKKDRTKIEKRKAFWTLFLVIFGIWFIICLSYYPGNLTSDSTDMWAQATGVFKIGSNHSPFYVIIMNILSHIWKNPFIVILFNITLFSYVVAHILSYFYDKKVKLKTLIILEICFGLSVNNVSLITMLWKDIPFTLSMIWLTFELYKLLKQDNFKYNNLYSYIPLIISLIFVRYFRINGIIPYIFVLGLFLVLLIKNKCMQYLFVILITISASLIIKYPIYSAFKVDQNSPSADLSALNKIYLRGFAAVLYYDYDKIEDYTDIDEVIDSNLLITYYNPYNNDTFDFTPEFVAAPKNYDNIQKIYFKYFFKHFKPILRNQLDSTNLLWAFYTPQDGFNYTYSIGINNASYLTKKDLGIDNKKYKLQGDTYIKKGNFIYNSVESYKKVGHYNNIIYTIFYRPAISLYILIILLISWIESRKKHIISMIPTFANVLFWCGFLYHQSYRYLWFIFADTLLLLLINFYENSIKKAKN